MVPPFSFVRKEKSAGHSFILATVFFSNKMRKRKYGTNFIFLDNFFHHTNLIDSTDLSQNDKSQQKPISQNKKKLNGTYFIFPPQVSAQHFNTHLFWIEKYSVSSQRQQILWLKQAKKKNHNAEYTISFFFFNESIFLTLYFCDVRQQQS